MNLDEEIARLKRKEVEYLLRLSDACAVAREAIAIVRRRQSRSAAEALEAKLSSAVSGNR